MLTLRTWHSSSKSMTMSSVHFFSPRTSTSITTKATSTFKTQYCWMSMKGKPIRDSSSQLWTLFSRETPGLYWKNWCVYRAIPACTSRSTTIRSSRPFSTSSCTFAHAVSLISLIANGIMSAMWRSLPRHNRRQLSLMDMKEIHRMRSRVHLLCVSQQSDCWVNLKL